MQHSRDIDKWLSSMGYYRKLLAHDETCLFRAVSEQIFNTQLQHEEIRNECITYAYKNKREFEYIDLNWKEYLKKLKNHMVPCGYVEIQLISKRYNYDIIIFDTNSYKYMNITNNSYRKQVLLSLSGDDHFDSVYKKEYIDDSGFCQSIVYNILYKNVLKLENVESVVNAMLYDKPEEKNYVYIPKGDRPVTENENSKNRKYPTPFPYKVAKALHPYIYRNVSFDTWGDFRREWRLNSWYQGDDDFKIGTRCILNMIEENQHKRYHCYIQKMENKNDPIYVYIEELGKFKNVSYDQLDPEPNAKPWAMPLRFGKYKVNNKQKEQALTVYKKSDNSNDYGVKNHYFYSNNQSSTLYVENDKNINTTSCYVGCALNKREPIKNSRELVPYRSEMTENDKPELLFNQGVPVVTNDCYIPPKSVTYDGNDLPQDTQTLQYFYNLGIDYCNFQKSSLPMYQTFNESSTISSEYNICDRNNNFTYFTQVTTETSYMMPAMNPEIPQEFIKPDQAIFINPNVPIQPIPTYQYLYPTFVGYDNFISPLVPPNTPICQPILSPPCVVYNAQNQFVFPPESFIN